MEQLSAREKEKTRTDVHRGVAGRRTCAVEFGTGTSVGVANLASASDSIGGRIMRADGVVATATVVDRAAV